ncbi:MULTISPECIES: N-acetylmuramic acid 6-phosphate etherase [Enterobacter cloacae complex]|uniref:N-acetylmuramic acid 6-phosphate etherase n=1 Tax=Enterobacter cloacae complex TaxID=354276 RepID=UPI001BCAFAA9|nr:N-acetylmuramic acid 6-phosphate etherase [Enterobacter asburiae]EHN8904582.1 N-acetylmuramic acid 6-phosphate etherase [Enterobacter asburiae]MCG7803365.1 N-acetylmuramic acid 6-phosphate etherase [Enterobacter asburiae]MCK6687193.1 N-acetylmuramic acid 6-phosphate etherase [Enterobacter asburiae]MCK7402372.1 N-acetylmuramic acid 6-phosphate etherase [Enterobacter asburiae]BEK79915.1 N-acetylmuramic acid 6-phosphate etherase [Enterobacter asburiae]
MSVMLTGSVKERRHASTMNIDRLSTLDMLKVIHQDDALISAAITPCLDAIARVVDNAAATLSHGGRLIVAGAGPSGRVAQQVADEYAPGKTPVMAVTAQEGEGSYERGVADLQAIKFGEHDMMLAVTVSGKTPWVWGAMRHAWSLGSPVAIVTGDAQSEAAQLASMVIAPELGADVVAGYINTKAGIAQKMILSMIATGLAVRTGRVYSNLRVDLEASATKWAERQIAIVMEAGGCTRAEAKAALASCNHNCKTAVLMVLTGLDAWKAHELLAQNNGFIRVALQEAP